MCQWANGPNTIFQTVIFHQVLICVWYAGMHSICAAQCHLAVCHRSSRASRLTWRVTLNHWMVVHLESGIATTAREAYYVVLAIVYNDGGLINGDVIRPHIEDDTYLSLILWIEHNIIVKKRFKATTVAKSHGRLDNKWTSTQVSSQAGGFK